MNEEIVIKREWVKKAGIVFLVIMLILTFFSNTIMNISLPEVYVKEVTEGQIQASVSGSGVAKAVSQYQVAIMQSRTVKEVYVEPGDTVEKGDVLFALEDEISDQLKMQMDTLEDLDLQYQKMVLNASNSQYELENRGIDRTRKDLKEASKNKDDNDVTKQEVDDALDSVDHYEDKVDDLTSDVSSFRTELSKYSTATDEALRSLERQVEDKKSEIENSVDSQNTTQLELELARLEEDYKEMVDDNKVYNRIVNDLEDVEEDLQEAKDKLKQRQERYDKLNEKYQNRVTYETQVEDLQNNLDDQKFNLEQKEITDEKAQAIANLDLNKLKKDIAEQKEEIEKLQKEVPDGKILAEKAGVIETVDIAAGTMTNPNAPLATIETTDRGYSLSFSVTKEQSEQVAIGDVGSVSGSDITAKLSQIKNDAAGKQGDKILTFLLEGSVESGEAYTVDAFNESRSYDLIIPKSALHYDSNGYFVFAVSSQRTPFGGRYQTKRVSVEVLEQDGQNVAVQGNLRVMDFVITTSSKPLKENMNVRMANNY